MPTLRPELSREPLPERIARLPIDARGYPIPWFVEILPDGSPEFRAMDGAKWARAVNYRRCWVCGDPLGRFLSFVVGPMCGLNRTTSEPPCHLDCAVWSARFCPFLSRPHMVRREDDEINDRKLVADSAGFSITRNPGVALVWTTTSYEVFKADRVGAVMKHLITMGDPVHVRWFAEGRPATRHEVERSIAGGLPFLRASADTERDAIRRLDAHTGIARALVEIEALYPSV